MADRKTALVVAAHPDDETLGCGGTICRLAREGHAVYIAILGEGITSRHATREQADRGQVETLQQQSSRVADLLGAKDLFTYGLPDNRFDTVPLLDIVKIIENIVERVQPSVVYTHHGGDLNIDHALVHRATLTATRPVPGSPVLDVYAYEVPSATDWSFAEVGGAFRPNVFVEVADTLDAKLEAMALYEGEVREFPHPRSAEALSAAARRWGSTAGVPAAEAFELVRSVRATGP